MKGRQKVVLDFRENPTCHHKKNSRKQKSTPFPALCLTREGIEPPEGQIDSPEGKKKKSGKRGRFLFSCANNLV